MLLQANELTISVPTRTLLEVKSLEVYEGDRIGLIGKNGTGKSTLLHTLAGEVEPERGEIIRYSTVSLLPQLKKHTGHKSGGEVTQRYIQQAFSKQNGLLLADEPTTHLDQKHIEWIEQLFSQWQGAFIVVSHDRAFLDAVCTKIWEIADETIHQYVGNYEAYSVQKQQELEAKQQAYENYQAKKEQLERAIMKKEQKAARATKKPKQLSRSEAKIIGAKPYFAKKQKKLQQTAKALETRLKKLDKVEKPFVEKTLQMHIPYQEKFTGRNMIQVSRLDGNIGHKKLWNDANFFIRGGDKVAIIGENGAGKTTLLQKLLTDKEHVTISSVCKISYFKQDLTLLDETSSILDNVKETAIHDETLIRTVLARLHFYRDDVYKQVNVLSGGERVKVALAKLFLSNSNTLILDEPTNFLDIEALEALEKLLLEYAGTVLFVSHDRRFVEKIATKIIAIEKGELIFFDGTYEQFQQRNREYKGNVKEQLLLLETKISGVLSRLSIEPSEELEAEFQALLQQKRTLEKEAD